MDGIVDGGADAEAGYLVGCGVLDFELVVCYDGLVVDEEGDGDFAGGGSGGGTGASAERDDGHFDGELLCEWKKIE